MEKTLTPQDIIEEERKDIPSDEIIVLGNPHLNKVPRGQIMKQEQAARKAAKALLFEDPVKPKPVKKKVTKKKTAKKKTAKKAARKPTKK